MARTRSGSDSDGGAAGVARDSVVNQILSKMDGVDPLEVPTLVIAMTNRPSLIDPALLRPGRFEVQIEVPPPRSLEARRSILHVHMTAMYQSGRLQVRKEEEEGDDDHDHAPQPTITDTIGSVRKSKEIEERAATATVTATTTDSSDERMEEEEIVRMMTYQELLTYLSKRCDGYSGAQLSAIPRAAASRALERAVSLYSVDLDDKTRTDTNNDNNNNNNNKGRQEAVAMFDCVVTLEDLDYAVDDVGRSAATTLRLS